MQSRETIPIRAIADHPQADVRAQPMNRLDGEVHALGRDEPRDCHSQVTIAAHSSELVRGRGHVWHADVRGTDLHSLLQLVLQVPGQGRGEGSVARMGRKADARAHGDYPGHHAGAKGGGQGEEHAHVGSVGHDLELPAEPGRGHDGVSAGHDPMGDDLFGFQSSQLVGGEGGEGGGAGDAPGFGAKAIGGAGPAEGATVGQGPGADRRVGCEGAVGAAGGHHVHVVTQVCKGARFRVDEVARGVLRMAGVGRGEDGDAHVETSMVQRRRIARPVVRRHVAGRACTIASVKNFESAFITGASSGIGRSLAQRLASKGTRVVAAARREHELHGLVESIRAAGGRADACILDVADTDKVREAIRHWDEETGGLSLVIANAGFGRNRPAHKLSWEDVEQTLRVNVMGAFATLMAGLEGMVARGRGTLVGVSSLASMRGLPASGAYAASKAALATFLETLRADLDRKGICVVDVRPGFVDTAMTRQNKFKMPFLMDVERAADLTLKGIERGDAIVAYPWPTASVMSLAETLPDGVWRMIAKRVRY